MVSILWPHYVALLSFYSSSVPVVFQRFFYFIFLFRVGVCPGSSVLESSSGGLVASSACTASSLSSPSVLPTSVTISCLVPSSPCVFACRGRAAWLACRQMPSFRRQRLWLLGGQYRLWSRLGLRPRPGASDHAFEGEWGPVVPHQYLAGRLWAPGRRQ